MTGSMKIWLFGLVVLLGMVFAAPRAVAQTDSNVAPLVFRSTAEEARFHALSAELRCVMCQNQSLADSQAIIARDLRAEVLSLMRKGMTDAQIKTFLVQRYGEFVLYRPRMSAQNALLWFGPLLLLVGGSVVLVSVVRKRRPAGPRNGSAAGVEEQEW